MAGGATCQPRHSRVVWQFWLVGRAAKNARTLALTPLDGNSRAIGVGGCRHGPRVPHEPWHVRPKLRRPRPRGQAPKTVSLTVHMVPIHKRIEEQPGLTLVLGATGKTGRRVAAGLAAKGIVVRAASRSATPAFDWNDEHGWADCLEGAKAAYINYPTDLPVADAPAAISAFVRQAKAAGLARLVLLTGRGEDVGRASEEPVKASGLQWTIVRSSWFNQNFSEGDLADLVKAGQLVLPAGETQEPFVDLDDLADVVVAALTESGHGGEIYEVTGPRLMTFGDIAFELSQALSRKVTYVDVPHQAFLNEMTDAGVPRPAVELMDYLFGTVLDGRNAYLADGVSRALGRAPKDFTAFAREAADGAWRAVA